jgi:hypothetical protein
MTKADTRSWSQALKKLVKNKKKADTQRGKLKLQLRLTMSVSQPKKETIVPVESVYKQKL